jgi:hypothetical protein
LYNYSFIHIRLVVLLPFKVIAAFQTYFSHYSHPAPRATLGHTVTGFAQVSAQPLFVSLPPNHTLFWFLFLPINSFIFFKFLLVVYLYFICLALSLFFLLQVILFHICFPTVLAVCFLGPHSSYMLVVSTPLSNYWLSSPHMFCYLTVLSSFYVIGFLSYSESWPVRMEPIRCPETSVNNYHTTPCNNPEDHRDFNIRYVAGFEVLTLMFGRFSSLGLILRTDR